MSLPKQVLIVEDEVITQRYLMNILDQGGVDAIECFDNGDEVLSVMKERRYDMVLMDINIKGAMDGIQLTKHILRMHRLPVVFISAYSDDETLDEVLELAPFGFVTKPFSSSEVLASVKIAYKRFLTFEEKNKEENENLIILTEHYTYSQEKKVLYKDGRAVEMNAKQSTMIEILVKNLNHTVSFEEFIREIWGENDIASSALRTLVYSIRKQLPDLPLHTHSKTGYYLTEQ